MSSEWPSYALFLNQDNFFRLFEQGNRLKAIPAAKSWRMNWKRQMMSIPRKKMWVDAHPYKILQFYNACCVPCLTIKSLLHGEDKILKDCKAKDILFYFFNILLVTVKDWNFQMIE